KPSLATCTRACAKPTRGISTHSSWCRRPRWAWASRSQIASDGPLPCWAMPGVRAISPKGAERGRRSGHKAIGVFDSGLGGLSIVRALIDLVPGRDLVYFGDTARFPYGPKPADEVAKFATEITQLLLERDVGMIVVACNTAAAVALDDLQQRVDVPVVGVIEP